MSREERIWLGCLVAAAALLALLVGVGHAFGVEKHTARQAGEVIPRVALRVVADSVSGVNVFAEVEGFRFAPERAGGAHVPGEGHAHLYVDGVKLARVYGAAFHVGGLAPGPHEITYGLYGNDHAPYLDGDRPVADTVQVEVPPRPAGRHHHGSAVEIPEGSAVPRVTLEVRPDPVSGWNLHAEMANFDFTPENVGATPRAGEGHAHLYVDGVKVARVYGPDFHLTGLEPGVHRITFALSANDHVSFTHEGMEIGATAVVEVESVRASAGHRH